MEIPYTVSNRPDTGVYNAKLAIWLFLASEVMLFGGLFSAYVYIRMGTDDGYWPQGLLNVPVGTLNTVILIASSISVVFAWAALKMRNWKQYKTYLGTTILLGAVFLTIKLAYEYPAKFNHFGAYIKKDSLSEYEKYLDNEGLKQKKLAPRVEITGHLEAIELTGSKEVLDVFANEHGLEVVPAPHEEAAATPAPSAPAAEPAKEHKEEPAFLVKAKDEHKGVAPLVAEKLLKLPNTKLIAFEVKPDEKFSHPKDAKYDHPTFFLQDVDHAALPIKIKAEHIDWWSGFFPKHSNFLAIYFAITGLHGLHIVGGLIVFGYFFFFGESLYRRNPEQMANRLEVSGLYWHFVDLVWIFVFPVFYLL